MYAFKTILFSTDFSENSCLAFRAACALAQDSTARVIVFHADPRPVESIGGTLALPPLTEEFDRLSAEAKLRSFRAPALGERLEYELAFGDPVEEIVALARKRQADVIVMGSHGHGGVRRMLLGSVVEKVLHEAPCSVLTVKGPCKTSERDEREETQAPNLASAATISN